MYQRLASRLFLPVFGGICLLTNLSSAAALFLGIAGALALGNPYSRETKKWTHRLLSLSVIGLGAGMNLLTVIRVGGHGVLYTAIGISATFLLGHFIGRLYQVEKNTSTLITVGTAICGGSAIAALAPVIRAKHHEISVSLGTVFMLNALALLVFPSVGHWLHLSETQFGLWSALAIHDTSSVVGATLQYGTEALRIGTTVKLARALWIVPVTFAAGIWVARSSRELSGEKPKRPWFILGFILLAAFFTEFPDFAATAHLIENVAKRCLVLTLFLIGSNLTRDTLRAVGVKPLLLGITLWIIVASVTLFAVANGWMA